MSKVPVIARDLCRRKLDHGFWEADYGPGYREEEGGGGPNSTPPKEVPSTSKSGCQLEIGCVHGYPDYAPDLAVGKTGVQDVSDLLQA